MFTNVARVTKGTVSGAAAALIAKFVLNSMMVINGVGWLDQLLGNPPWWMWLVAGGIVGGGTQAARIWKANQRSERLPDWAAQNGWEYHAVVSRDEFENVGRMSVFDDWHQGNNYLLFQRDKVNVEMFDLTIEKTVQTRNGTKTKYPEQTVSLIRQGVEGLPDFQIFPIRFGRLPVMGREFVRFDVSESIDREDLVTINRFQQLYAVSPSRRRSAPKVSDSGNHQNSSDLEKLRAVVSIDLMRLLNASPGWSIELAAGDFTCWKPSQVVAASKRSSWVEEVMEVRDVLVRSCTAETARGLKLTLARSSEHPAMRAYLGSRLGGFFGVAASMFVGMYLFVTAPFEGWTIPLVIVVMVMGAALGSALGFLVGRGSAVNRSG